MGSRREITKTNNRQNRIENRDFVSLDPEQARIRNELASTASNTIYYGQRVSHVVSPRWTSLKAQPRWPVRPVILVSRFN